MPSGTYIKTEKNKRNRRKNKMKKTNSLKGRTYEEIHGIEKAKELKEKRRLARIDYVFPKETIEKIRKSNTGKPHPTTSGDKNPSKRQDVKDKISKSNTGKIKTKKQRQNMSKAAKLSHSKKGYRENQSNSMTKRIINGEFKPNTRFKNGYFYSELNNKKIWYRSSYELKAYEILDDEDSKSIIKSWKTEPFKIPYKKDGVIKNTVPDILVKYKSGKKQLISVKPEKRLKERINILKHEVMEKYCKKNNIVFSIWTEKELDI